MFKWLFLCRYLYQFYGNIITWCVRLSGGVNVELANFQSVIKVFVKQNVIKAGSHNNGNACTASSTCT